MGSATGVAPAIGRAGGLAITPTRSGGMPISAIVSVAIAGVIATT